MFHIFADEFQFLCDCIVVLASKIVLDQEFQLRIIPMQKQHVFKRIIAGIHAEQQRLSQETLLKKIGSYIIPDYYYFVKSKTWILFYK